MRYLFIVIMVFACLGVNAQDVATQPTDADLFDMSLEQLMNVEIVSASKKSENLFDAPVASYTISRAEIETSGVTTIQEALRLCPGFILREQNNGNYFEHLRGLDNPGVYAIPQFLTNALTLVMIDNRPVFNYNSGGTNWESLPIDLNDIERIEIVKGPSSALYGPNAVNGVVNIITTTPANNVLKSNTVLRFGQPNMVTVNQSVSKAFNEKFNFTINGNYQRRERSQSDYYNIYTDQRVENRYQLDEMYPAGMTFMAPHPSVLPILTGNPDYPLSDPLGISKPQFLEILSYSKPTDTKESKDQYFKNFYPEPTLALQRMGTNAFLGYKLNENVNFGIQTGAQKSIAQRTFFIAPSPHSFIESESQYISAYGNIKNFRIRSSANFGFDNLQKGRPEAKMTYHTVDIDADYTYNYNEKLSIRPGLNYQSAVYGDEQFTRDRGLIGFLNDKVEVASVAASLRLDYSPIPKLRLVGGARIDRYTVPEKAFPSVSVAGTYKANDNWLIRLNSGRAYAGSFFAYSFADYKRVTQMNPNDPSQAQLIKAGINGLGMYYVGDKSLEPTYMDMFEMGFRNKITEKIYADVAFYYQRANDFKNMKKMPETYNLQTGELLIVKQVANMPLELHQLGTEISLNMAISPKLQIKPFITYQHSELRNFNPYFTDTAVAAKLTDGKTKNAAITETRKLKSTPDAFGGFYIDYKPTNKITLGLTGYFMSEYELSMEVDGVKHNYSQAYIDQVNQATDAAGLPRNPILNRNSTEGKKQAKLLINLNIVYQLNKQSRAFFTLRNVLNQEQAETYGGDKTPFQFFGGLMFNFSH